MAKHLQTLKKRGVCRMKDKPHFNAVLRRAGVPVPRSTEALRSDGSNGGKRAARAVRRAKLRYPVVLKPSEGTHGTGVTVGIADSTAGAQGHVDAYGEAEVS